jgi:hypothetical protein
MTWLETVAAFGIAIGAIVGITIMVLWVVKVTTDD